MDKMVSVYPIRYQDNNIQFLMIKRVNLGYNLQCVTGDIENRELSIETKSKESI
jgi:hypothetical protein